MLHETDSGSAARRDRQKARKASIQALYATELGSTFSFGTFAAQVERIDPPLSPDALAFSLELGHEYFGNEQEIDQFLRSANPNWKLERLGILERSILRLGVTEIRMFETPALVVISEGVRLAEMFVEKRAVGMIHAILDRARKEEELRAVP